MTTLDGNALAGALADALGRDLTDASCRCAHCGAHGPLASVVVHASAMGSVARCPSCTAVLLTVVQAPDGRSWFGMPGITAVDLPR